MKVFQTIVVVAMLLAVANASHFRYMTISWSRANTATRTVCIDVEHAWRATAFGSPAIGTVTGSTGNLQLGDGRSAATPITVTNNDLPNNWFVGITQIMHTYIGTGTTFTILYSSCCRIGGLANGNGGSMRMRSTVFLGGSALSGPKISVAPIVDQGQNVLNTFPIPSIAGTYQNGASVSSAGALTWAVNTDSGLSTTLPSSGTTMSLSTSGVTTWTPSARGLYAFSARATQPAVGGNPALFSDVDFIFEVVEVNNIPGNDPPEFVDSNGNVITSDTVSVQVGGTATYTIRLRDPVQPSTDNRVGISAGSLGVGSTLSACAEGETGGLSTSPNTCTKTLTLNPPSGATDFPISFTGVDADGLNAFLQLQVRILPAAPPSCQGSLHFKACHPINDPVMADCLSIRIDVGKLYDRGFNAGVMFNIQNTCAGTLYSNQAISNVGDANAQVASLSPVNGNNVAWGAGGCTAGTGAAGLSSPGNYGTDLEFDLQPDSAMLDPRCYTDHASTSNVNLVVGQSGTFLSFTGIGGDNVDAITVTSTTCNVFRSTIDGPCDCA